MNLKAGTRDFKVKEFPARRSAVSDRNRPRRKRCAAPCAGRRSGSAAWRSVSRAGAPALHATERVVRSIAVTGNQRLEPETIRAYANLLPGQTYTAASLDQALKDLYATQLFADVTIIWRRHRRPGHLRARKSGDQPHRARRQQAHQGRQDSARDQARAAADLHPIGRALRCRADPRAVSPSRPFRGAGRAQDRPARPEPRRCGVRDLRGRPSQGPGDQRDRQQ